MQLANSIPVLTVNRVAFLGGVERVIVSCGRAAKARGFQPILACPAPGDLSREARDCGIEVVPVRINRSRRTKSPLAVAQTLLALRQGQLRILALARDHDVRLIHAHHPVSALYAAHAARALRVPLVLHVHETLPVHKVYAAAARRVIPHCAAIVCVSEQSRELMIDLGARVPTLSVVYNCADPSFLESPKPVRELASAGPHIGLFGVLEPRKGQDLLISAAQRIVAERKHASFWIVGDLSFEENSSYVDDLRSAINLAGLSNNVHLVGFRRNVRDWMAKMDVIVLASRELESLPTVLIEGGLLGRPLVSATVGGVREIIEDGRTGLLVPPGDSEALASAISRAIGPDGLSFGQAAREQALHRFTFDRFADDIAALYRSLLGAQGQLAG